MKFKPHPPLQFVHVYPHITQSADSKCGSVPNSHHYTRDVTNAAGTGSDTITIYDGGKF